MKISLIKDLAENLRKVSDLLIEIANVKEQTKEKEPTNEKPKVTIEEIRSVLAEKSQEGLTDKVKALLESFGANKLSDVKEENYPALLEKAIEL